MALEINGSDSTVPAAILSKWFESTAFKSELSNFEKAMSCSEGMFTRNLEVFVGYVIGFVSSLCF